MITLRQLEYFTEVVTEQSFTRAATALHVSQPCLSRQIRALERRVGGALIERKSRSFRLTPLGRAVLAYAREVLCNVNQLSQAAKEALRLQGGNIELATVSSLAAAVLPRALRALSGRRSTLRVQIMSFSSVAEVGEAVRSGRVDLGVGPLPPGWAGAHCCLGSEELVVLCPGPSGPLTFEEETLCLARERWIDYVSGHHLFDALHQLVERLDLDPRIAVRTDQAVTAVQLVAAGAGIALAPADLVGRDCPVRMLQFTPPLSRRIFAFTRQQPDAMIIAFQQLLQGYVSFGRRGVRPLDTPR